MAIDELIDAQLGGPWRSHYERLVTQSCSKQSSSSLQARVLEKAISEKQDNALGSRLYRVWGGEEEAEEEQARNEAANEAG
jgi:hypothetical protein